MNVIFQLTSENGYDRILVSNGGRGPKIEMRDLPREVVVKLGDRYDTGIYLMPIDTTFPEGRCGQSHHVYTEAGQLKIDGNRVGVAISEIDDFKVTVAGLPKFRRL